MSAPRHFLTGPAGNPDAETLSAFKAFTEAYRHIDTIPHGDGPIREAAYEAMYREWDRIAETIPTTAAGLAAYLKVALYSTEETPEIERAVIDGEPLESGYRFSCTGGEMLWKLIQHLEGAP